MAVSANDIKSAYPLPVYNYKVEIGSTAVAFSEVSGLSIAFEKTTYKESNTDRKAPGPRVMHMPSQATPANVTLKRGVIRQQSVPTFFNWINSIRLNQIDKRDIYVRLCDEQGDAVITWKVTNAFPTKLDAPTFDANSNDVAIETMELMADGVFIEES
jgi:phage tail-like protein